MNNIDAKQYFLLELKADHLLLSEHVQEDENNADLFAKNLQVSAFGKHSL